jgi:hypothetical protein
LNRYLVLVAVALAACKGGDGPTELGPPASMSISPTAPTAPANTEVTGVTLTVLDANSNPLPDQTVTFAVTAGGGSITTTTATTGPTGTVTVPAWKLGKVDVAQVLTATVGALNFTINAAVQTSYNVVVRFYGSTSATTAQQALFTNAAARIRGVITGDVANVTSGANFDISACTPGATTTISETIDDVVIYVRIAPIDGQGNVLASAGPCFVRSGGTNQMTTVIGTMQFDQADMGILREETVLHEMLHVIGVGAMWVDSPPDGWALISGAGTTTPTYTGANGRQGCQELNFPVTCASSVPVENSQGQGTADVHWEEDIFDNELMTGFIESQPKDMPFSIMSVRSLMDIGYTVNLLNFDSYTKPVGALPRVVGGQQERWEVVAPVPVFAVDANMRIVRQLRRAR